MNKKTAQQGSKVVALILLLAVLSFSSFAQSSTVIFNPDSISKRLKIGDFVDVPITITNTGSRPLSTTLSIDGSVAPLASLNRQALAVNPGSSSEVVLTLLGQNQSIYRGSLHFAGEIVNSIPINLTVSDVDAIPVEALLLEIEPITERTVIGDIFEFKVGLTNLLSDQNFNITLQYSIDRLQEDETFRFEKSFFEETEQVELDTALSIVKEFAMPDFIRPGTYVINVKASYLGLESSASRTFKVIEPIWDYVVLGIIPVRWLVLVGTVLLGGIGAYIWYLRRKAKKKRYVSKVDYNLLPKPGPRAAFLGFIAETTKKAYFDLEALKTHTLIAGSTGGGKTVSAEVVVEEALLKGVSVMVFDPTAQWSGFLRKNTQKKMFALYPKFGMKKADARAFNGNVRQILNAREIIEVKKFMKPGEINVFSINKLDPEDADVLVSNTIREIFHANMGESPELRLMIIFDEVHRLLPKFGGSGQGFIQIERAAREFRKWGVGLMLISQVLTDFVGETKANINTEIQMRTRDQGDLDRIKSKYGGYMLQSLLKSSTGTGMMENASYNKGNPYFVAFRPLMHEHARLSDEELENYNKYNSVIDELEFQIDALEKEKVDVFDLRLELKMALDKVKSGSFNMVDIYLEGLKPRLKEQWKKLGKEPVTRKAKLVSESELREEFMKAQEARKKFEAKEKAAAPKAKPKEIKPLSLVNGIMIGNETEMIDALESLDEDVFKKHVNDQKNDFATWLEPLNAEKAAALKKATTKDEMLKVLQGSAEGAEKAEV